MNTLPGRPFPLGATPGPEGMAEPWDVGRMDSYDLGRIPPLWSERNGRYRDVRRDCWCSHGGLLGEFADGSPARPTCTPRPAATRPPRST